MNVNFDRYVDATLFVASGGRAALGPERGAPLPPPGPGPIGGLDVYCFTLWDAFFTELTNVEIAADFRQYVPAFEAFAETLAVYGCRALNGTRGCAPAAVRLVRVSLEGRGADVVFDKTCGGAVGTVGARLLAE